MIRLPPRAGEILGWSVLTAAFAALFFSIALTKRTYMPCPFWDEWVVVNAVAHGAGPWSWSWLWAQSNEHRIAIPRLLIWADLAWLGGRNISLFTEIFMLQALHWMAVGYAVERFTTLPSFVKRTIQGLFGFCLFHPNQAENFTWAFQVSFIAPSVLATTCLLTIAFYPRIPNKRFAVAVAVLAPAVASMSLASGLLIAPVAVLFSLVRRLPHKLTLALVAASLVIACAYLYSYRRHANDLPLGALLPHLWQLFVYVLTYFGASWTTLLPHKERITAFVSIACFLFLCVRMVRKREQISDLECFLIAECCLALLTALVTAAGRLQFGVGQAFASRYQTPAMLYWASLTALFLVRLSKRSPRQFLAVQVFTLAVIIASVCTFPGMWQRTVSLADPRRAACQLIMTSGYNETAAKTLYENTTPVQESLPFLRQLWGSR